MQLARAVGIGLVLAGVLLAGCAANPEPSRTVEPGPDASGEPSAPGELSAPPADGVLTAQLVGGWRRAPIELDNSHVAIISDACAVAARDQLGDDEADLPTAVIDARGEGVATAILADDLSAIQCFVHLDATAQIATVDSVARLSTSATAAVGEARITVANVTRANDLPGGRTIAFGRVGPDAFAVKLGFDDGLVHTAASADGWWSMWWPGVARASSYAAVDAKDLAIGSVGDEPNGLIVAAVGSASWWLDPAGAPPTATSTTIKALVREQACASGRTPEGRVDPPTIELDETTVTVTFAIRHQPGDGQDCQGNAPFPVELVLPEPLGARTLLDGSEDPPRKAGEPPAG